MSIEITPLRPDMIEEAAALFLDNLRRLRQTIPALTGEMEEAGQVTARLRSLLEKRPAAAALKDGKLVGYLGGYVVPDFRSSGRTTAYCPEWAHAAQPGQAQKIYRDLYRAASSEWWSQGCQAHALTLLAHDEEALQAWFWNGFGMLVVDAVRAIQPLGMGAPAGYEIRQAGNEDADAWSALDAVHCQHYAQPPVFMAGMQAEDPHAMQEFIRQPGNSIWMAWQGADPAGFMRFEARSFGAAQVASDEHSVAITGAYVHPAYRGKRLAPAILDAAQAFYAGQGIQRLSVDFEAFNPEAADFWMRYFQPVCYSLMRVLERQVE